MRLGVRLFPALACLTATVALLGAAGCGGSSANERVPAAGGEAALIDWPLFGRVPERTHYLPDESRELDPPLHEDWSINTHALLEFPPAVGGGVAFLVDKYGNMKAVRLQDRKVLWERLRDRRQKGPPKDTTAPVFHRGRVFVAFEDGDLVAIDAADGKRVWKRNLGAHLESSPLAVGGTLYLGDDKANLVAVRAADGAVRWRLNTPGAIKASPSHHDGRIFVADYEGTMFSVDAESGKLIWRTNTTAVRPFGEGGFYSSPAVGFGNVYAARDDGTVYAFDQRSGEVRWFFRTGDYVYGSPAIAEVPGTPPSVYIGSYDEHFYALDARSGARRWRYDVGGAVPGTAVVVGRTVYTSSFKTDRTIGLDASSGRKVFTLPQAGYTPVVSDGRHIYAIGYFELVGLRPGPSKGRG